MNIELENKLINNHWILYKSLRNDDSRLPFPMFGIECDDGWYEILDELCRHLESLIDEKYPELKTDFFVDQIKEKYGTLSFYVSGANDEILNLIDEYEMVSSTRCEACGRTGKLTEINGWWVTLCDKHIDERKIRNTPTPLTN